MFYKFRQNNSGGYFDGYHNVIIEASDAVEANRFAEQSGYVYFDARGDCVDCCGYRWDPFLDSETYDNGYSVFEDCEDAKHAAMGSYYTSTGDNIVIFADGSQEIF